MNCRDDTFVKDRTFRKYSDFTDEFKKYCSRNGTKFVTAKSKKRRSDLIQPFSMKVFKCHMHTRGCNASIRICLKSVGKNKHNYQITRMRTDHTHVLINTSQPSSFNEDEGSKAAYDIRDDLLKESFASNEIASNWFDSAAISFGDETTTTIEPNASSNLELHDIFDGIKHFSADFSNEPTQVIDVSNFISVGIEDNATTIEPVPYDPSDLELLTQIREAIDQESQPSISLDDMFSGYTYQDETLLNLYSEPAKVSDEFDADLTSVDLDLTQLDGSDWEMEQYFGDLVTPMELTKSHASQQSCGLRRFYCSLYIYAYKQRYYWATIRVVFLNVLYTCYLCYFQYRLISRSVAFLRANCKDIILYN